MEDLEGLDDRALLKMIARDVQTALSEIQQHRRILLGNGAPGLVSKVEALEVARRTQEEVVGKTRADDRKDFEREVARLDAELSRRDKIAIGLGSPVLMAVIALLWALLTGQASLNFP